MEKYRKQIIKLAAAAVLALLSWGFVAAARKTPSTVDWYRPVSKGISGILGRLFSFMPYSAAEFLLYAGILLGLFLLIRAIVRLVRVDKGHRGENLLRYLANILLTGSILLTAFLCFWGINYFAPPLADRIGLTVRQYTAEELYETAYAAVEKTNEYAVQVNRDENGVADLGSFDFLARTACESYESLSQDNPVFAGIYSKPKKVTAWIAMAKSHISGIYFALTGECNVNPDLVSVELPFTMAHEMAHRLSVAPEDEANFTAFLACRASDSTAFNYSAYLHAYLYTTNALGSVDAERQGELWNLLCPEAQADIRAMNEYYYRYEGPISEMATAMNDTYLKTMRQTDGVKSYGMVADLLIAEYLQNGGL